MSILELFSDEYTIRNLEVKKKRLEVKFFDNHKALKAKKIRLIAATATEVDITKLFGI